MANVAAGNVPTPDNCTVLELVTVLSRNTRFAALVPAAPGLKMIPTLQLWPLASVAPAVRSQEVVLASIVKSLMLVPEIRTLVNVNVELPVFERVTNQVALAVDLN